MTKFVYKALKDGKAIEGEMEAPNKEALIGALTKQGLHPLVIKQGKTKGGGGFFSMSAGSKKVKLQDLVIFTRQLSTMISAGVPLARSLAALANDSESPYLREVLTGITKEVEGGAPLGDAFAKYPNVFSDVYVNMVRAGENGGILDEILKRLAAQVEQDASIRKKIKSAMMYPIVILSVTVLAFFGIMLFIVPKIGSIMTSLAGPNAKLPIYTRVLLHFSDMCVHATIVHAVPVINKIPVISKLPNLIFILIVMGIAGFYLMRYIKTPEGKYKFHAVLLRIPIIKVIILKIAIARFSRTFASLMSSGVSVLDALAVTGGAIGNKVIEAELKAAAAEVKNGKQLSEPLSTSKHFPPIVSQMLAVGEETGQMDTVLVKVADFYEEEVSTMIDGLAAIIEPIMIIFLGAGVGLIAASVMGPIANLSKQIGTS
ncbi:MAG TPA: type II secretion system F family protein [Candidatus Saccharimonadales bacterium]|nr:type II secretion system F family protein [Candidatus Saccharimonadales bacterium]